ncbi:MAG: hypothetical protein ABIT09_04225 [Croceibacterium sp.]
MRWIFVLSALLAATPLNAQAGMAVESAVFIERAGQRGVWVEPAASFSHGDTVVTVMTWQAPARDRHTIVSAVPVGLELESVSRDGLDFSIDGGHRWQTLADARDLPRGVTHLRWHAGGDGRLSYRAVVR